MGTVSLDSKQSEHSQRPEMRSFLSNIMHSILQIFKTKPDIYISHGVTYSTDDAILLVKGTCRERPITNDWQIPGWSYTATSFYKHENGTFFSVERGYEITVTIHGTFTVDIPPRFMVYDDETECRIAMKAADCGKLGDLEIAHVLDSADIFPR